MAIDRSIGSLASRTHQGEEDRRPPATVLSVAGSDPSGGAGLQADIRVLALLGIHPASVVTAVTVQSADGVHDWSAVPAPVVGAQLDAVFRDGVPAVVKSGMLGEATTISHLAARLEASDDLPYVCDPILLSGTGVPLLETQAVRELRERLLPLATLVTPNVNELEALTGSSCATTDEAVAAARVLIGDGVEAVLVKGGHRRKRGIDLLVDRTSVSSHGDGAVACGRVHGAGCFLASAVAGRLALGDGLSEAVDEARRWVGRAISSGRDRGGVRYLDPGGVQEPNRS